eukprot:CAMPEP_0172409036 /NCGR_PEP_ID=MMETSP1061-20121228/76161_1 /TAXON_ID=37318 /ORGANISM="Pseudo-nitzschia pungens, Strain cf. pungens" /LENGTH=349 /DNA_ID=CAMNT_0013145183 /DNA_START=238 /DNA_END=1288 /DNA_ORIENTATION=-
MSVQITMRTNGMHYNPIQSNARPIRTLQQNEQKLTVAADRFYSSTRRQYKQQTKLVINAASTPGIRDDTNKDFPSSSSPQSISNATDGLILLNCKHCTRSKYYTLKHQNILPAHNVCNNESNHPPGSIASSAEAASQQTAALERTEANRRRRPLLFFHPQAIQAANQTGINAVGTDRLGIVQDMTKEVIDAGGNVGASQAAKLGKYFSLMMLVEVPESAVQALEERLETLEDLSTSICVAKDDDGAVASTETIGYKGALSLEGADHPGIVHKVTKILSSHGLNIDSLETTDELAPQGGTVLFRMIGITHAYEPLSAGFDVEKIKQELSELGDALNCDILLIDLDDDDVF